MIAILPNDLQEIQGGQSHPIKDLFPETQINFPIKGALWLICGQDEVESLAKWLEVRRIRYASDSYRIIISLPVPVNVTLSALEERVLKFDLNIEARKIFLRVHADDFASKELKDKVSVLFDLDLTIGWRKSRSKNEFRLQVELPAAYTDRQKEGFGLFLSWLLNQTSYLYKVS